MWIYMCVCMSVYVHAVCIYVCYEYVYVCISLCERICVHLCVWMYVFLCALCGGSWNPWKLEPRYSIEIVSPDDFFSSCFLRVTDGRLTQPLSHSKGSFIIPIFLTHSRSPSFPALSLLCAEPQLLVQGTPKPLVPSKGVRGSPGLQTQLAF